MHLTTVESASLSNILLEFFLFIIGVFLDFLNFLSELYYFLFRYRNSEIEFSENAHLLGRLSQITTISDSKSRDLFWSSEPAGFGKIFSGVLFVVLYFSGEAISSILEVLQAVLGSSYWALKYWYIYWSILIISSSRSLFIRS